MQLRSIFCTLLLSAACGQACAQEETLAPKRFRNEFGIDATGFIRQFLIIDNQGGGYSYSQPIYYLTYRRHFKPGNIRFAIGGDFTSRDIAPAFVGDVNKYSSESSSLNLRIGWEFVNELSKRWQVYYGVDFRSGYYNDRDDAPFWNGGYANGMESKAENYAVAPLLGFRLRLTKRLSILTESSFSVNWQSQYARRYYIPVTTQYPPQPDFNSPTQKRVFSSFSQPLSVFITFDI